MCAGARPGNVTARAMSPDGKARIDRLLDDAARRLESSSGSPRLDAEVLLARTIDMPRSYLYAHPEDELEERGVARFESLLARREAGEPMAYIMGTREFWSRELVVSPATLVPRPETELLVELALCAIPRKADWRILDAGTGSGAIAIAIACERPTCCVTATDISRAALVVARINARHHCSGNVDFLQSDWTGAITDRVFDLVVCNPPYVRADDEALASLRYEPQAALAAGADGLSAFRRLAADCQRVLKPGGGLLLEHGADQEAAVRALLEQHGWIRIACHRDYSGRPRVTAAYRDG